MLTKVLVAVSDVPFCAIPDREFLGQNISRVGHFSSYSYTNSSHCTVTHQAPPSINIIYYSSILNSQDLVSLVKAVSQPIYFFPPVNFKTPLNYRIYLS